MLKIDLVYVQEDDATRNARNHLRDALHFLDLPPRWEEWSTGDASAPPYARTAKALSVFVEGHPVDTKGAALSRAKIMMSVQDHLRSR